MSISRATRRWRKSAAGLRRSNRNSAALHDLFRTAIPADCIARAARAGAMSFLRPDPAARGLGMTSQRARDRLVERLAAEGIRDRRVLDVIRQLPRHLFIDEALASRAYEDTALPIGQGQTISQPWVVARMTEALIEHAHAAARARNRHRFGLPMRSARRARREGSTRSNASRNCCATRGAFPQARHRRTCARVTRTAGSAGRKKRRSTAIILTAAGVTLDERAARSARAGRRARRAGRSGRTTDTAARARGRRRVGARIARRA